MHNLALSEREKSTLRNIVVVAAERFDEDAKHFRALQPELEKAEAENPEAMRMIHSRACPRLAEQFDLQAKDARELLAKIDAIDEEDDD